MRRTVALAALVAVGALLVVLVEPPARRSGPDSVRGPRVFRTSVAGVRRLEVTVGGRRLVAERTHDGWRVDGVPAPSERRDALHDLVTLLAGLRAIDAFRASSFAAFGLDPPSATIVLVTPRGPQRLALGRPNTAGSALYARRDEQARVLQLGIYLVSALDRVLAGVPARAAS